VQSRNRHIPIIAGGVGLLLVAAVGVSFAVSHAKAEHPTVADSAGPPNVTPPPPVVTQTAPATPTEPVTAAPTPPPEPTTVEPAPTHKATRSAPTVKPAAKPSATTKPTAAPALTAPPRQFGE
jgi:autotransporter family porin